MKSQMSGEGFRRLLEKTIAGDRQAFEAVLKLYEPMLTRYATVNGSLDEDLRQHILLQIVQDISEFEI